MEKGARTFVVPHPAEVAGARAFATGISKADYEYGRDPVLLELWSLGYADAWLEANPLYLWGVQDDRVEKS